jgi:hypothetical protein
MKNRTAQLLILLICTHASKYSFTVHITKQGSTSVAGTSSSKCVSTSFIIHLFHVCTRGSENILQQIHLQQLHRLEEKEKKGAC